MNVDYKYNLLNVLIINFINAIESDNEKLISEDCSRDNYEFLYEQYFNHFEEKEENPIQLKIDSILIQYKKDKACLDYINYCGYNKEIVDYLINNGYKISTNIGADLLKELYSINNNRLNTINILKLQLPESNISSETKNESIYDIITKLSMSVGYDLDYNTLTMIKFISYIKNIKKQQ